MGKKYLVTVGDLEADISVEQLEAYIKMVGADASLIATSGLLDEVRVVPMRQGKA